MHGFTDRKEKLLTNSMQLYSFVQIDIHTFICTFLGWALVHVVIQQNDLLGVNIQTAAAEHETPTAVFLLKPLEFYTRKPQL